MNIQHIQQTGTSCIGCLFHLIQVAVQIPVIALLCLEGSPFGRAVVIRQVIVGGVAIQGRAEDLRIGIQCLHCLCHFHGFFVQLRNGHRIRMQPAVSGIPQSRLIVQAVALDAGSALRISQLFDDVMHILIHIYVSVRQIRRIRKGTALGQHNLVPPVGGSSLRFGYGTVLVRCHIACQLQSRQLIANAVGRRLPGQGLHTIRRITGIGQMGVRRVLPVCPGIGCVGLPVVASKPVAALPDGVNREFTVVILVSTLVDAIDIGADRLAFAAKVNCHLHLIAGVCAAGTRQSRRQGSNGKHQGCPKGFVPVHDKFPLKVSMCVQVASVQTI